MGLFLHKLNPFTEFTISQGPLYVDRLFDCLLAKEGIRDIDEMNTTTRLECYLDLLRRRIVKCTRTEYPFIQFYTAHFCQQMADNAVKSAKQWYENALSHYQLYLGLTKGTEESRYYAQWQTGRLQDLSHHPWAMVNESLLKANAIDPLRGESINNIVHHYVSTGDWENAYSYSKFAKNRFYSRNPIANRRWHIDFDCYNGNLLDTHIIICNNLAYWSEAEQVYQQLLNHVTEHIHEFQKVEKHLIQVVDQIYHGDKLTQTY